MRTLALLALLALFAVGGIILWLARPRRPATATPGSYEWMWERAASN